MNKPLTSDSVFILSNLMENLPDAIYFKDRQSRFIMINQACAQKHRWGAMDQVAGKTDFDVFSREHAQQAYEDEQQIIATGRPLYGIIEKETFDDGSVAWVSTSKMPLRDGAGEIIGTFGISRDITKHVEAELREQRYVEEIRAIKEEIEEDVHMAGELQKAFFPRFYPVFSTGDVEGKEAVQFSHRFRSYSDISGDYCSVQRVSTTEAGVFLCDVQGIGLQAALGTAVIRGVMQELSPLGLEPGTYLERMNQTLLPLLSRDKAPIDITACYLVLNVATGVVCYARAGHPSPLLIHADGNVVFLGSRESDDVDLAVQPGACYTTFETKVKPGDKVVLYTDGLLSVVDEDGDIFGGERLLESAKRHAKLPFEELLAALEADAAAFSPDHIFCDDVCIVGFHFLDYI